MAQPTAYEQFLLELINSARLNPLGVVKEYGIGLNDGLNPNTISSDPKQPLAYNFLIDDAANFHSQWMLDNQKFQHGGETRDNANSTGSYQDRGGDRMEDAGYEFTGNWTWGENLGNIGTTGTLDVKKAIIDVNIGLLGSPYHRLNIFNDAFREAGISTLRGDFAGYDALLVTEKFAKSGSDVFLTGVAFDDLTIDDNFYSVGEGLGQIDVVATRLDNNAIFSTTTTDSGGYQIALDPGTYQVSFKQNNQTIGSDRQITLVDQNIKLDLDTSNLNQNFNKNLIGLLTADSLLGSEGNDTLVGNQGNDTLKGGDGDDVLKGSEDNDILIGNAGDDILYGGTGDDRLYVATDNPIVLNDTQVTGDGTDTFSNIEFANLYGGNGNNLIDARGANLVRAVIKGNNGNDTLRGGENNDTILGGNHNDILFGEGGDDILNGNGGSDRLYVVTDNKITLNDTQVTGDGTDTFYNIEFANLYGRNGNNLIDASDANLVRTVIKGDDGNDTLIGGQMSDNIQGGNGNDILYGGSGDDILIGNGGADIFVLESVAGTNTVRDFLDGVDSFGLDTSLGFSDLSITNSSESTAALIVNNVNNQLLATVSNVDAANLTVEDFVNI